MPFGAPLSTQPVSLSREENTTDVSRMPKAHLQRLIAILIREGYTVIGPKVEDSAIVYAKIQGSDDLPQGFRDSQEPGKYRVLKTGHQNFFEFNLGPHSWKQFLFPPQTTLASGKREPNGWTFSEPQDPQPKFAFLGVRACELSAIAVQDRVFLEGPYVDPVYKARRESALLIAVNCTVAATTCFCSSMDTGPKCSRGFDLALTELDNAFVIEAATERGRSLLMALQPDLATAKDIAESRVLQQRAVDQITKRLDTANIRDLLLANLEHPRWDEVATRCLSCTNCTMVCPTCFCSSVSEVADLSGDNVHRQREWDSCFNLDFSYTSNGVVRNDRRSRYRQWLTHKLASWHDQFDSSGCVGCGRCITWCPVGIDITEEVAAIRVTPPSNRTLPVIGPLKTACTLPQGKKA
jgi:sulfhydrogenase subunit beta (sulfur reductase)